MPMLNRLAALNKPPEERLLASILDNVPLPQPKYTIIHNWNYTKLAKDNFPRLKPDLPREIMSSKKEED